MGMVFVMFLFMMGVASIVGVVEYVEEQQEKAKRRARMQQRREKIRKFPMPETLPYACGGSGNKKIDCLGVVENFVRM